MQLKPIIVAGVLVLSVAACSTVQKVVYRIDVPQGNYLEAATVSQVQAGMTTTQVQYLLGTPVLIDPFSRNTWYYVYLQQRSYEMPEQHTLTVKFDQRGIVTNVELDKPLPEVASQAENNTIIEAQDSQKREKSWWKFW